jgi:hypothetical protein
MKKFDIAKWLGATDAGDTWAIVATAVISQSHSGLRQHSSHFHSAFTQPTGHPSSNQKLHQERPLIAVPSKSFEQAPQNQPYECMNQTAQEAAKYSQVAPVGVIGDHLEFPIAPVRQPRRVSLVLRADNGSTHRQDFLATTELGAVLEMAREQGATSIEHINPANGKRPKITCWRTYEQPDRLPGDGARPRETADGGHNRGCYESFYKVL